MLPLMTPICLNFAGAAAVPNAQPGSPHGAAPLAAGAEGEPSRLHPEQGATLGIGLGACMHTTSVMSEPKHSRTKHHDDGLETLTAAGIAEMPQSGLLTTNLIATHLIRTVLFRWGDN